MGCVLRGEANWRRQSRRLGARFACGGDAGTSVGYLPLQWCLAGGVPAFAMVLGRWGGGSLLNATVSHPEGCNGEPSVHMGLCLLTIGPPTNSKQYGHCVILLADQVRSDAGRRTY